MCAQSSKTEAWRDRFWKYVPDMPPDECWEWTGSRDPKGYGQLSRGHGVTLIRAHRASWELHHGPIPEGYFVCHHCDNPPCANPAHLFVGTPKDNSRDMARKGRSVMHRPGFHEGRRKLSDAQVREVRSRARGGEARWQIAVEFGVSKSTIDGIVSGMRRREAGGFEDDDV